MTRLLFQGGNVFDGTGAAPAPADVVIENGRILEVGTGLDGDQAVDCTGSHLLPGLFDTHVHVLLRPRSPIGSLRPPRTSRRRSGRGSPRSGTRAAPTWASKRQSTTV